MSKTYQVSITGDFEEILFITADSKEEAIQDALIVFKEEHCEKSLDSFAAWDLSKIEAS